MDWKTLEGGDLKEYQNGELTLNRDPSDWHPYNPNAERNAQIEAEGIFTDPIRRLEALDQDEQDTIGEPATPDFDL